MFPNQQEWTNGEKKTFLAQQTAKAFTTPISGPISDDTVSNLRQRLHAMKEIFGESDEENDDPAAKRRREKAAAKRRKKNCMDTIIDGSFMGMVLAVCLTVVLGAAFFAYKNLYYAVLKKMYPEAQQADMSMNPTR